MDDERQAPSRCGGWVCSGRWSAPGSSTAIAAAASRRPRRACTSGPTAGSCGCPRAPSRAGTTRTRRMASPACIPSRASDLGTSRADRTRGRRPRPARQAREAAPLDPAHHPHARARGRREAAASCRARASTACSRSQVPRSARCAGPRPSGARSSHEHAGRPVGRRRAARAAASSRPTAAAQGVPALAARRRHALHRPQLLRAVRGRRRARARR